MCNRKCNNSSCSLCGDYHRFWNSKNRCKMHRQFTKRTKRNLLINVRKLHPRLHYPKLVYLLPLSTDPGEGVNEIVESCTSQFLGRGSSGRAGQKAHGENWSPLACGAAPILNSSLYYYVLLTSLLLLRLIITIILLLSSTHYRFWSIAGCTAGPHHHAAAPRIVLRRFKLQFYERSSLWAWPPRFEEHWRWHIWWQKWAKSGVFSPYCTASRSRRSL